MTQRAVRLLADALGIACEGGPVGRLLLAQGGEQPLGEFGQVVEEGAGGPVQDAEGVGVDEGAHAGAARGGAAGEGGRGAPRGRA